MKEVLPQIITLTELESEKLKCLVLTKELLRAQEENLSIKRAQLNEDEKTLVSEIKIAHKLSDDCDWEYNFLERTARPMEKKNWE